MKDCTEDSDMFAHADALQDGYSQSKWVAEQLVIRAMERGLPAAVYRPGTHTTDALPYSLNAFLKESSPVFLFTQGQCPKFNV